MTLISQYEAAQDELFRKRVRMAMVTTAEYVYSEDAQTAGHAARAALATKVLTSGDERSVAPDVYLVPFCYAVAGLDGNNDSTDQELKDKVASVWDAMAGA